MICGGGNDWVAAGSLASRWAISKDMVVVRVTCSTSMLALRYNSGGEESTAKTN
ncbi:hypothetical protein Hanom_Chr04g00354951 [Helianthus anomalus]